MKKIFNILGFKISWWACVFGATSDFVYIGPFLMLLFLIIHFYLNSPNPAEIKLVIIFAFLGTLIDSMMAYSGILTYNGIYKQGIIIAPLWITAMWCGFAAMVNHSMAWLKGRWVHSLLLGGFLGPVAYKAGEGLGAINFNKDQVEVTITLAIVWGLSMPLIYWVNDRLGLGDR
tara:strand:+ start:195 stop:716 length:522 start_codon:yes stop_codon:yes gene_type:complete